MERVRKTFFDPLATSKDRIRGILESLPVGSTHPFSPEGILLCKTENGIEEIDISACEESYFYNAVDLGEMGEVLLRRMSGFKDKLEVFKDFHIQQAPALTFKIPIKSNRISIFAVSERIPTYYDFCIANAESSSCCYSAVDTFKGITHSGDVCTRNDLLQYVKINETSLDETEYCVFISGFQSTKITRFLGTNPALLVANYEDKVLNIIPVPLDSATIRDATICCPLVIKRDQDSLICSILPNAATDQPMSCTSWKCESSSFREAIARADFDVSEPTLSTSTISIPNVGEADISSCQENLDIVMAKQSAIFTTHSVTCPSVLDLGDAQMIKFGTGLKFVFSEDTTSDNPSSKVVFPCIFGNRLEGAILLATGTMPINVPFLNEGALRGYYEKLDDVVFIVDEQMTDNARNLAASWRINALFVLQLTPTKEPTNADEVLELLNGANINAVTALAGPQSLVLIQISDKLYFYRGLADISFFDTSAMPFGADVTSAVVSLGLKVKLDPRIRRIVNLDDTNSVLMPASGQWVKPQDLPGLLEKLPIEQIEGLKNDVLAAVSQLQVILSQKEVVELSTSLIRTLSAKVDEVTAPHKASYINFVTKKYNIDDPESVKKKNQMLGKLRMKSKVAQNAVGSMVSSLGNMVSTQTTSKRAHDLKRLVRQAQIQNNVDAAHSMTFETLAEYLETYAESMGVMLLNINSAQYKKLLGTLQSATIDANSSCSLDSRILHLEGLDAGIIIEQGQKDHKGPLRSHSGSKKPTMALPCLSQRGQRGSGSTLAWVCWDEFVILKSPYTVRWIEKCNEAHISALRIIMRSTLSQAVSSRQYNLQPGSPETGQLMSALLMAAMEKLAAMRTTVPTVVDEADDTVTKLMRGLFGNFLTIAGSGVRPLSMVWQLFGQDANFDIPTTNVDWSWYETAVKIYPYTGWPLTQFHDNLGKLIDKAIIRVVTKNENVGEIKMSRMAEMAKYCKLRNIQLEHSRTIITVFMQMLTTEDINTAAVAARLLDQVPQNLKKQSAGYSRMIRYLKHLAEGGEQRVDDNLTIANVYIRRSAAFGKVKSKVSGAWKEGDWAKVKKYCQIVVDTQTKMAVFWRISPDSFRIQNMKVYKQLLDVDFGLMTKSECEAFTKIIIGDAEKNRIPWQVGKKGEFGDEIEPLDDTFVHQIMTGEILEPETEATQENEVATKTAAVAQTKPAEVGFSVFKATVKSQFINQMDKALSPADVCAIIGIPVHTMAAFVTALNPEFVWNRLGESFKDVILDLLKYRSDRTGSHPVKKLLELTTKGSRQIEAQ